MPKKVDDARLIEVLIECGGVTAAAQKLPLTKAAIYKRLKEPEFRMAYEQAQDGIVSAVAGSLTQALDGAVEALVEVVRNPLNSPGLRISAADSLLRHAARYIETSSILRRIADLEAAKDE